MDSDVAVLGAGPYGLSIAAHLRRRGVEVLTFGRALDTWREHMPAGMLLKSDGFASNLDSPVPGWRLADYCARNAIPYADRGIRVRLESFIEYALAFQRDFVPDLDDRLATRVTRNDSGFTLELEDGCSVSARRVVLATGISYFARTLPVLGGLGELASHSRDHRVFDRFAGKRVAVIGAGSSATEVAASLLDAGAEVHLLCRAPELFFWSAPSPDSVRPSLLQQLRNPPSGIGSGWRERFCQDLPDVFRMLPDDVRVRVVRNFIGPVSGWWLREKVLTGMDIRRGVEVRSADRDGDEAVLGLGSADRLRVDHVIAATGYAADVDRLQLLDEPMRRSLARVGPMAQLSRHFESSVPGLYLVGPPAAGSFGPLMRFMVGSEFATPRVVGHLVAADRHRVAVRAGR